MDRIVAWQRRRSAKKSDAKLRDNRSDAGSERPSITQADVLVLNNEQKARDSFSRSETIPYSVQGSDHNAATEAVSFEGHRNLVSSEMPESSWLDYPLDEDSMLATPDRSEFRSMLSRQSDGSLVRLERSNQHEGASNGSELGVASLGGDYMGEESEQQGCSARQDPNFLYNSLATTNQGILLGSGQGNGQTDYLERSEIGGSRQILREFQNQMQTMREHMGTSTIEKSSMRGKDAPSNSAPNAGGYRNTLQDFQDQMLTMREHIEILTAENSALRGLDARSNSRPAQGREQLQSGDFKFTDEQEEAMQASSREDRVERLQDSLRQLMTQDSLRQMMDGQDVQSIHSSTYTTSRNNVAEKTDAMRRRIEELEAILADQQANRMEEPETTPHMAYNNQARQEDLETERNQLVQKFQAIRAENQGLFKKLMQQEEILQQTVEQGNEKQQTLDMQQEEIFRAAHALSDAEREIGDLRAQNAQIAAAAREAESQANADHNSEGAARRQLEGLRMEYLQVMRQQETLTQERDNAITQQQEQRAESDEQLTKQAEEIENLKLRSDGLQHHISQSAAEHEALRRSFADAQKDIAQVRTSQHEVQTENEQLAETLQTLTAEHASLLDEQQKTAEHIVSLSSEKDEVQKLMEEALAKLQETQAEKEELMERIADADVKNTNLQGAMSSLNEQLHTLTVARQELETANKEAEVQIKGLKSMLEESQQQASAYNKEASATKAKKLDLEASLAESLKQITFWKSTANEAAGRKQIAEEELQVVRTSNYTLQQKYDKASQGEEEARSNAEQLHKVALTYEDDNTKLLSENMELNKLYNVVEEQLELAVVALEGLQEQLSGGAGRQHRRTPQGILSWVEALQAATQDLEDASRESQEKISAIKSQHRVLQSNHEDLVQSLAAVTAERDDALRDWQDTSVQLSASKDTGKELAAKVDHLIRESSSLQAAHDKLLEERESMTDRIAKARGQFTEQQDALADLAAQRDNLSELFSELKTQHSQLQGENSGLHAQYEELANRFNDTNEQLTRMEADSKNQEIRHSRLQNQLKALQATHADLDWRHGLLLDEKKASEQAHNEKIGSLEQAAANSAQNFTAEIKALEQAVIEARQQVNELRAQKEELQETQGQLEDHFYELSTIIEDLQALHEDSARQAQNLEEENTDLLSLHAKSTDRFEGVSQVSNDAKRQIEELQQEILRLRRQEAEAQSSYQDISQHSSSLEELVTHTKSAYSSLEEHHKQLQEEHGSLTDELKVLRSQHEEVQQHLTRTQQEFRDLTETHNSLDQTHEEESSSLISLRADHEKLVETGTQQKEALLALDQQYADLLERHANVSQDWEALTKEHNQLQHDHAQNANAFIEMQMQHEELQRQQEDTLDQFEKFKDQQLASQGSQASNKELLETLRAELSEVASARAVLQEQLNTTEAENAALSDHVAHLEEESKRSKEEVERLHVAMEEEQAVTRGVLEECQTRATLIDQLERDLAATTAETDVYHQEHKQASEEWEKEKAELQGLIETRRKEVKTASSDLARMKGLLDQAHRNTGMQTKKLEDTFKRVERANSEALAAKQKVASLQMDLANALDRHQSAAALAEAQLEMANQRQQALEEELRWKESKYMEEEDEFVDALEGSDTASATTNKASRHAQEILTANRRVTDLENKIKLAACKKLDSEYTLRSKLNTVSAQGSTTKKSDHEMEALQKQLSELRSNTKAALAKLEGTEESQELQRDVIAKLEELTALRSQHTELKSMHSVLTMKYKEKKAALLARGSQGVWTDQDRKDFAERHSKLSKELQVALDRAAKSEQALESEKENIAGLHTKVLDMTSELSESNNQAAALRQANKQAQDENARLKADALKIGHSHGALDKTPGSIESSEQGTATDINLFALTLQTRYNEDNDLLRARTTELETDIRSLIENMDGGSNPKQKLQYHMRNKQELEDLRSETTTLLTERYQLEQCIRYLAVRCNLSSIAERTASSDGERTPLARLQPSNLVPHYAFTRDGSNQGASAASPFANGNQADLAVEQEILSQVAAVCSPPASAPPDYPRTKAQWPGTLRMPSGQDLEGQSDSKSTSQTPPRSPFTHHSSSLSTPEQKERDRLRAPETAPSTPSAAPAGINRSSQEVSEDGIRSVSLESKDRKRHGGFTLSKEETLAKIKEQNERLGKKISRVFQGRSSKSREQ